MHEGKALNPVVVVDRARCLLTEYDKALSRPGGVVRLDARQSVATPVAGGWRPPGLGLYKVNWAIFLDLNSRHCLLGSLVRDHERCVLGVMVMKLPLLPCGIHSTVGAVLYTLKFASVMGFGDIILEGHVLSFLQSVGPISAEASVQDMWLEKVEVLCQKFSFFSISAITKEDNVAALALAQLGSYFTSSRVWVEDVPVEIRGFL